MASTTIALPTPAASVRRDERSARWVEFLLTGGVTLALFPVLWWLRRTFGLGASEYAVGFLTFYGAFVVNDPHFAVTYLLFYKDVRRRASSREFSFGHRLRYGFAGFVVPAGLALWAAIALGSRSAQALGWMIQLMFLLVGWHYAKQGFGVLMMLSARRGVFVTRNERVVILFHCFAGWAYAWANPAAAAGEFEEKGVVYWALAHPRWLELATGVVLAASFVALIGILAAKWRREGRTIPIAPLAGFLITIWSWTIYSSVDRLVQYFIPALHSVQYLYFVWLMKKNEARAFERPPWFGRPVAVRLAVLALSAVGLGCLLFHAAPSLLDAALATHRARGAAPDTLGATPFFAAFFVVVNLHHYFMDAVIWRREHPDTRYLREGNATRAAT